MTNKILAIYCIKHDICPASFDNDPSPIDRSVPSSFCVENANYLAKTLDKEPMEYDPIDLFILDNEEYIEFELERYYKACIYYGEFDE